MCIPPVGEWTIQRNDDLRNIRNNIDHLCMYHKYRVFHNPCPISCYILYEQIGQGRKEGVAFIVYQTPIDCIVLEVILD